MDRLSEIMELRDLFPVDPPELPNLKPRYCLRADGRHMRHTDADSAECLKVR